MKRPLALLLAATLLLFAGCAPASMQPKLANTQAPSVPAATAVQSVSLYPVAAYMPVGRELKLQAILEPAGAAAAWSSSDEAVATVDCFGTVIAKAPGQCTVTVTCADKSAACAVWVKEECRTVIFSSKPSTSEGENPPQPPPDTGEGEPPIEVPDDVNDVSKLPQTDEFVWILAVNERFSTVVTQDNLPLRVQVNLSFNAEKQGGKTPLGIYTGSFDANADYDRDNFMQVMNQQLTGEGSKITDYTETDTTQPASITVEVTQMDDVAFHEVQFGFVKNKSLTQQVPLAHLPGTMMALGEVTHAISVFGTMTIEVEGYTVTLPFGKDKIETQPYTLCIFSSGYTVLSFPQMAENGFERNWAEGTLIKRPLV